MKRILADAAQLVYLHGLTPMEALAVCLRSTEECDSAGTAALAIRVITGIGTTPQTVRTHISRARAKGVEPWNYPPLKGEGNENVSTVNSEDRSQQYVPPKDEVFEALEKALEKLEVEMLEKAGNCISPLFDYDEFRCAAIAICYPAVAEDEACDVQASAFLDAWIAYDDRLAGPSEDGEEAESQGPMTPKRYRSTLRRLKSRGADVFDEKERARWRGFVNEPLPTLEDIGITL